MFDFFKKYKFTEEDFDILSKQVDDLKRELLFEQRERLFDATRVQNAARWEALNKDNENYRARVLAEAKAEATALSAAAAEECAKKCVEMAAKCAADFATATGTLTEKFLAVIKELKPAGAQFTVLSPAGTPVCHSGDNCKK